MSMKVAERFWEKVDTTGECWLWMAATDWTGYGRFWNGKKSVPAHRFSYEEIVGEIGEGLQLDHLCRVRNCVRPSHLEAVSCATNISRGNTGKHQRDKTHCPHGHEYTDENVVIYSGKRNCRACIAVRNKNR